MSVLKFNHVVVVADKRTMNHLNLEGGPNFESREVDSVDDLSQLVLRSMEKGPKAIFIGTGNYDASEAAKLGQPGQNLKLANYNNKLQMFFDRNQEIFREANLVFIKPRVKKEYNHQEKAIFGNFIGVAYQHFLRVNPTTTLLTMDKKPALVNAQYKLLFKDLFAPQKAPIQVRSRSSSSSSSHTPEVKPEPEQKKEPEFQSRVPSSPTVKTVSGHFNLYFKGFDFVSECAVEVYQNGNKIGETEKYSKKDNNKNAWFEECVKIECGNLPLDQNLEMKFGNWGHLNVTMGDIMNQEIFKVHAFKKKVSTSRVSIIALDRTSSKSTVKIHGNNFKKMDMIGKTDAFFKVWYTDNKSDSFCIYTSEVVGEDLSPQFEAFELVDGRFDIMKTKLEFEFWDKDSMSKQYMGRFGLSYVDVKNAKHNDVQTIKNDKEESVGEVIFVVGHQGAAADFTPSAAQNTTKSFRVYFACRDMQKESNQVSWAFGEAKKSGSTEKVTKTNAPSFDKCLELDNINENSNFQISFSGSNKENCVIHWQDLKTFLDQSVETPFGEAFKDKKSGLQMEPHLQMVLVEKRNDTMWTFTVDAVDLPIMDSGFEGSKTDPYFKLYMDGKRMYISEKKKKDLNPHYEFSLPGVRVNALPEQSDWHMEWFDSDMNADDAIGTCSGKVDFLKTKRVLKNGLVAFQGIKEKEIPKDLDKTVVTFQRVH